MKKYLLIIALLAIQMAAVAQTVNVHFKNGQTINYPSSNVDYVDFSAKASDPTMTAGGAVDLGLSVYWASCNLGAERPEEYGEYYAWGETSIKSKYDLNNYSYYDTSSTQYTDIGADISGTQYDAATINLGSDWRMPTKTEMQELISNCTWEWMQISGINGYKVTGPNGNSIFLPAAGHKYISTTLDKNTKLDYWTSTQYKINIAHYLEGISTEKYLTSMSLKVLGYSIRPVTSNPNAGR
jgi:hypothetical protein